MEETTMEALLEPWWAVFPFRTLLVRQWERDLEIRQRFLGLQLVLGPATVNAADTWRRYCEAVELLLLASSVHPRAFREMALERCMSAGGYEWGSFELEECIPVRLFVLINYSRVSQTYPTWHLDALSILLTPPADHSDAYKTPLSQLSKMTGGKIASRQTPVVHSLSALDARVNEPTIRVLDCISQLHQKRIQEELHYSSCLHRFGIEWVDLTIITGTVHPTSGLIESIEAFKATLGLRINHVVFPKLRFDSHDLHSVSRGLLCRWVSAFSGLRNDFTASRMDLLRPVDFQPVGSKHVEFREPSNTSLTAFCSSIMHSGDVEHVSLSRCGTTSTCSEPSFLWCWLFYALFNATARHSVKHLTIEAASFPLEDMMSVCELIVSSRPLEMLTDPAYEEKQTRPASSANRPAQVVLRNGAQIHLELSQCPTAASTLTPRSTLFDVMDVLDDGYDILVPGYGQCWVKGEDVVSEVPLSEKNARDQWRLRDHALTKLEIHIICPQRDDQTCGLQVLLKLVGVLLRIYISLPNSSKYLTGHIWRPCGHIAQTSSVYISAVCR